MAKKTKRRPVTGIAAISRVLGGITNFNDREDNAAKRKKNKRALNNIRQGRDTRTNFRVL